jgi:hypothetical protein
MLHHPNVLEAKLVGQLDLGDVVLEGNAVTLSVPRSRNRDLVEQRKLHKAPPEAVPSDRITDLIVVSSTGTA